MNALGFCVGGTLLGAALAVLSQKKDDRVVERHFPRRHAGFQRDRADRAFRRRGERGGARRRASARGGILPGRDLAFVFSSLRANDLVWPYVVNNYLLGGEPAAFDLLYWNADSTNLPGPMYCYYLRNTYLENRLREPGALDELRRAGRPRQGEAAGVRARHARGPHRAVALRVPDASPAGKQGEVVRPRRERPHRRAWSIPPRRTGAATGSVKPYPDDPEDWLSKAQEHTGSWWPRWSRVAGEARRRQAQGACEDRQRQYQPIEPAPGRYVKQRIH